MKSTFSTPQQSLISSTVKAGTTLRPAARIVERPRRGFAAMDPEQQRNIAIKAGIASQQSGRGHKWTAEEAREAGRKGGKISRRQPNPKAA